MTLSRLNKGCFKIVNSWFALWFVNFSFRKIWASCKVSRVLYEAILSFLFNEIMLLKIYLFCGLFAEVGSSTWVLGTVVVEFSWIKTSSISWPNWKSMLIAKSEFGSTTSSLWFKWNWSLVVVPFNFLVRFVGVIVPPCCLTGIVS